MGLTHFITWIPVIVALTGWLIGVAALLKLRNQHLSSRLVVFVVVLATLAAGGVQFALFRGCQNTERSSVALLVSVTSLHLRSDSTFVRDLFLHADELEPGTDLVATFREKSKDISKTLEVLETNNYLGRYYSAWAGEIAFRRDQVDRAAERAATTDAGNPRDLNVRFYVDRIDDTVEFLDNLAREMRERPPELYYSRSVTAE